MIIRLCYIICLLLSCAGPGNVIGQCDQTVTPSANKLLSYRDRGNRCEGFFRSKVAAPSLQLVGFTLGEFRFLKDEREEIELALPVHTIEQVHIRAVGIPAGLFYRMDAVISGNDKLIWRVREVLLRHSRTSYWRNLGLLGFIQQEDQKIFVPLLTKTRLIENKSNQTPRLILRSPMGVERVVWRIKEKESYRELQKSYKAGKPIIIELPPELSGTYTIEVKARPNPSKPWLTKVFTINL